MSEVDAPPQWVDDPLREILDPPLQTTQINPNSSVYAKAFKTPTDKHMTKTLPDRLIWLYINSVCACVSCSGFSITLHRNDLVSGTNILQGSRIKSIE